MGILGNQLEGSKLGLKGEVPTTRAGALPTSQMHAQGDFGAEAPGFGKIDKGFVAATPQEATNAGYKQSKEYSQLDLDGQAPTKYENPETGRTY